MFNSIHLITEEEKRKARNFSEFRNEAKCYLSKVGRCYDKFTVTQNDSYLGYLSEIAIKAELKNIFGDGYEIKSWADDFDIKEVLAIVRTPLLDDEDADYVKAYFYDQYDLKITRLSDSKTLSIDVKTAETSKTPLPTWNFLYPVVQNKKDGKDYIILCYYHKSFNGDDIILIGCLSEEEISRCRILRAGEYTKFRTLNQVDNFETYLSQYKDISFLKTLI